MTLRQRTPSKQTRDLLAVLLQRPREWLHGYELGMLAGLQLRHALPATDPPARAGRLEAQWVESEPAGPRPMRHVYRLSPQGVALARSLELETAAAVLRPTEALGRVSRPGARGWRTW